MSINDPLNDYKYRGARALIILHEKHLRSFLQTWREAKRINVPLPKTDDEYYKSLETLLFHVLQSAKGYMVWICRNLSLPDPNFRLPPPPEEISLKADEYLSHLIEIWRLPLRDIDEEPSFSKVFKSNWGIEYSIDAMLEHAVMHPIRHEFQLMELINKHELKR